MKKKKTYEVPQLEEFDCRVEKGFAGSGLGKAAGKGSKEVEGRQGVGGWGTDGAKWT